MTHYYYLTHLMSPVPSVFQLSFVDLIVLKQTFIIDITKISILYIAQN